MTDDHPHLRVTEPGEMPPRKKAPKNITAALDGTSRDVLATMRRALAKKLDADAIASNSIAAAYKELRELDRLIRSMDADDAAEGERRRVSGNRERRSFDASAI